MTVREREERSRQWQAAASFADHQLLDSTEWTGGARWLIGVPNRSEGRTEIVAGFFGSVLTHGDFPLCRFAHGSGSPREHIAWIGSHATVDHYIAEKADIGMRDSLHDYDPAVARDDLDDEIADGAVTGYSGDVLDVLRDARDHVENESGLRKFLNENDRGWDLWERSYGRVVAWPVLLGHAAVRRLWFLLGSPR